MLVDDNSILTVGVGDGGIQSLIRMNERKGLPCSTLLLNTESKSLSEVSAIPTYLLGKDQLRGLGTAGDVELGWQASESSAQDLSKIFQDRKLVIFFSCLGGGTGSGALPSLVRQANQAGCLTLVFVCLPFTFLGKKQSQNALDTIDQMKIHAHGIIRLPNDLLLEDNSDVSIEESFLLADSWLYQSLLILKGVFSGEGLMKIDSAAMNRVFSGQSPLLPLFSVGSARGEDAVNQAVENLLSSPLLTTAEKKSVDGLLVYVMGGKSLTIGKVNQIVSKIHEQLINPDETILGAAVNNSFDDEVCIAVMGLFETGSRNHHYTKQEEKLITPPSASTKKSVDKTPVHQSKLATNKGDSSKMVQEELFLEEDLTQQNTIFDLNNPSLIDGINYDIPTFLRQGIKVNFK